MSVRVPSVKAHGPSKGVQQLEITVLEVILHVIPEIHCGEDRDVEVRALLFSRSHPQPIPGWALVALDNLTSNAAVGLLDMVKPQGWQVQELTSPHRAVKGLCLAVTGVPDQVWSQGVQWDPGHLETQQLPGSRL